MLTFEEARQLYESHLQNRKPRLKRLMDYYNGRHKILDKPDRKRKEGKDAKVVHNYPRYISTITTGYTGNVNYSGLEENEALKDIFVYNNESSVDSDLLLYASIFGEAYELQWLDEQGNYCFEAIDPMAVMTITDGRLRETVTDAIIFDVDDTLGNERKIRLYCYDDTMRRIYSYTESSQAYDKNDEPLSMASFEIEEEAPHMMGHCPVIQVKNNRWNTGDFELVLSEVDAYNLSVSNSVNDLNDNTDAMMVFKNLDGTTREDVEDAFDAGGFKVTDNGDVKWLIKNVNDSYSENIKNRLKEDIHKFSFVPDMSDEQFASNSSGVAIRYKLLALEQLRLEKVKWARKAILMRLYMISDYLSTKGQSFNPLEIGISFKANLPQNSKEITEFVAQLTGITSKATQLTQLGEDIVPNVQDEMEKIKEEKEENAANGFNFAQMIGGDNNDGDGLDKDSDSVEEE